MDARTCRNVTCGLLLLVFCTPTSTTQAADTLATSEVGKAVLLDFHADWCAPCRAMQPVIARLVAAGCSVRPINIDNEPALAAKYGVSSIPCFVVVVDGQERNRVTGKSSYEQLAEMVAKVGAPSLKGATVETHAPRDRPSQTAESTTGDTRPQQKPTSTSTLNKRLLAASVRLRVDDGEAYSYGSGTLIDQRMSYDGRSGEALVLTCAHIFRGANGTGTVRVERFVDGVAHGYVGRLVQHDLARDVALVAIRTAGPVAIAPLVDPGYESHKGDRVISIGCDHGSEPSIRQSQITAVNGYSGPRNLQIVHLPAVGRSGGGLFDERGKLVGVCNMADTERSAGLFADACLVHELINGSELSAISPTPVAGGFASSTPPARVVNQQVARPDRKPVKEANRDAPSVEVICIVRSDSGKNARSTTYVISNASQVLLDRLAIEHRMAQAISPTGLSKSRSGHEPADAATAE